MTRIAIYAEVLAPPTSAVPSREMLLELMQQRPGDRFTFVLCRGSEKAAWWQSFRQRIDPSSLFDEVVLPWSRRFCNFRTLAGARYQPRVSLDADLYLRLDVGAMGPESVPLINLVLDISAVKGRQYASMRWHGRRLFERLLREGAQLADRTVCISSATARDVVEWLPELGDRIRVIHNGIANEWFAPLTPALERTPSSRPYFIWYGYISPRKNIAGLLRGYSQALKIAGRRLPDLLLAGHPGIEEQLLAKEIKSLGLESNVRRMPPQPLNNLIRLVSELIGLAFPSLYEGFGVPIIEAFARGIPVLTSNVTSMPEVAGGLACLCDPLDPASIATGLLSMAEPRCLDLARMLKRRTYAARFTTQRAAASYSELIDEVLSVRA